LKNPTPTATLPYKWIASTVAIIRREPVENLKQWALVKTTMGVVEGF